MAAPADGKFMIVNAGTGLVVDLKDGSTSNGADVKLYHSENANLNLNQVWQLVDQGGNWFKIQNVKSHTFLGVDLDYKDNTKTQAWVASSANDNAQWTFDLRNNGKANSTTLYSLRLKGDPTNQKRYVLDNNNGHTGNDTKLQIADYETTKMNANQCWWLLPCNK